MNFKLVSDYLPSGDQPEAIEKLLTGLNNGDQHQVLLGVTGSGKTFTMANVISKWQKPTLVLSHNKTLAAQLYNEFKNFFPNNCVEFFISYYYYYQPEAFIPSTNTYIEKDLAINAEIEKKRLRATSALLSGRKDIIVVSSVSCIYGIGNPEEFAAHVFPISIGKQISITKFLLKLVDLLYSRTENELNSGTFRVKGDIVEVFPVYDEFGIRITFIGNVIESICTINPENSKKINNLESFILYPANLFVTSKDTLNKAISYIQDELYLQVEYFNNNGLLTEAKRILERTEYDLEMIREIGFCKGIENYSKHLTLRDTGSRPYCLLDYFQNDSLIIIDESHVTIPQIKGMYGGDRSRKLVLVENGFRLPSALDNRPLKFEEFESIAKQIIYVSATPGDYELEKSEGVVVEQIVRPTGLLDPIVEVRPLINQIDDLLDEVDKVVKKNQRVLVTTLTKRMSEELASYFVEIGVKARYIHSDIDTLERIEILQGLRDGDFDVLIGINLLREGLDLPEVALVAILDADKEGFLRSERSFIQIAGRAARNVEGRVILYGDKITDSMKKLIDETERRRAIQINFNDMNNIVPKNAIKNNERLSIVNNYNYVLPIVDSLAAEPEINYNLDEKIEKLTQLMKLAADELDFVLAAKYRDELFALKKGGYVY